MALKALPTVRNTGHGITSDTLAYLSYDPAATERAACVITVVGTAEALPSRHDSWLIARSVASWFGFADRAVDSAHPTQTKLFDGRHAWRFDVLPKPTAIERADGYGYPYACTLYAGESFVLRFWEREETGAYGIHAVHPAVPGAIVCGECGRAWLEDITPSGRCPWEDKH